MRKVQRAVWMWLVYRGLVFGVWGCLPFFLPGVELSHSEVLSAKCVSVDALVERLGEAVGGGVV